MRVISVNASNCGPVISLENIELLNGVGATDVDPTGLTGQKVTDLNEMHERFS